MTEFTVSGLSRNIEPGKLPELEQGLAFACRLPLHIPASDITVRVLDDRMPRERPRITVAMPGFLPLGPYYHPDVPIVFTELILDGVLPFVETQVTRFEWVKVYTTHVADKPLTMTWRNPVDLSPDQLAPIIEELERRQAKYTRYAEHRDTPASMREGWVAMATTVRMRVGMLRMFAGTPA